MLNKKRYIYFLKKKRKEKKNYFKSNLINKQLLDWPLCRWPTLLYFTLPSYFLRSFTLYVYLKYFLQDSSNISRPNLLVEPAHANSNCIKPKRGIPSCNNKKNLGMRGKQVFLFLMREKMIYIYIYIPIN